MRRFPARLFRLPLALAACYTGRFHAEGPLAGPWRSPGRSLAPASQPPVVRQSAPTVDGPVAAVHGRTMLSLAMAAASEGDLGSWSR